MEVLVIMALLIALDILALLWGQDSRDLERGLSAEQRLAGLGVRWQR